MPEEFYKYLESSFHNAAKALIYSLEAKDPYTSGHSYRVYKIAKELGERLGLNEVDQFNLEGGALLHDIGKVGIKDDILFKPGALTKQEFELMKGHVMLGANIVSKVEVLHSCLEPILYHHERIDGKGYPHGMMGDEIPFISKITTVADCYDAMTTNRVYRAARTPEDGLEEIIRCSGTQFEPVVVEAFTDWWHEHYKKHDPIVFSEEQRKIHERDLKVVY